MSDEKQDRMGAGGSAPAEEMPSIFDGHGETALLDARRLARAGELASRACADDDFQAFGALFRAVDGQLERVETWVAGAREEVLALRNRPERTTRP